MKTEFLFQNDVIAKAELDYIPRIGDYLVLNAKDFRINDLKWIINTKANLSSVVISLVEHLQP